MAFVYLGCEQMFWLFVILFLAVSKKRILSLSVKNNFLSLQRKDCC